VGYLDKHLVRAVNKAHLFKYQMKKDEKKNHGKDHDG